jgi:hypothetical protein
MKLSTVLLVGSLAANLAGAVAWVAFSSPPAASVDQTTTAESKKAAAKAPVSGAAAAASAALAKTWSHVETSDLRALIARLRAADFPPSVIRAIVAQQLQEQFADRRKAIIGEAQPFEYWKSSGLFNNAYTNDPKMRAALRDLAREQTNQMKELLGPDATEEDLSGGWRRRQFGNLSKEKVDQVNQVTQDYFDLESQVRTAANGMVLKEDRDNLAYLAEEKKKDLAAVLTPEELADYELHSSQTTNRLRTQLAGMDLTEDQFKAIYQLQKPYDDKYLTTTGGFTSAEMVRERQDAQKEVQAQIKAALGESLATQYEQAMDYNYQSTNRVVARLNLPKETVQQVMDVSKDIQARANSVRMDRTLSPDQRNAQLAALNTEATNKLTAAFQGERGLAAYKDNGGYWLSNLVPPPRP